MKQKTITLYEYSELTPEAKKKAHKEWLEGSFDEYGLAVHLDNLISELLEQYNIKPCGNTQYAKIRYSLGYSQGDGVMFEGSFQWGDFWLSIKHFGRYAHCYSKTLQIDDARTAEGLKVLNLEKAERDFEKIYQTICNKLEKAGYAYIEDMESEGAFIEACNANEYTFREDGTMENA